MSITPNMNLNLPDVSLTSGPEWADHLNTAIEVVDDHDHTSGKGKKVPASGLDINTDLTFNSNSVTDLKSVKLEDQASTLSGSSNATSVFSNNGNLYFTNSGGVPVQLTDGDALVSNTVLPPNPLMPAGAILDFAGSVAPVGFLEANGAIVSELAYPDLFAAIGTSFNTGGEGAGNFRLPNLNGKVTVGRGTYSDSVLGTVTRTIAQVIGAAAHILTTGQMPSHNHTQAPHQHAAGYGADTGNPGRYGVVDIGTGARLDWSTFNNTGTTTFGAWTSVTTPAIDSTGGSESHNNMQPSIVVMKIIKY